MPSSIPRSDPSLVGAQRAWQDEVAKAETLRFGKGRVDIAETPEEFPLGARGARPVRFTLCEYEDIDSVRALDIPGVIVRGLRIDCAWDVAPIIASTIGEPQVLSNALTERLTCRIPLPGKAEYDRLALQGVRREYQGEGARYLLRRAYALLGDPPRSGKCLELLMVCILADIKKTLILCNSLGKYVWAEEIAKWLKEDCVLLFGRSGHEVRVFCRECMGRGVLEDSEGVEIPCQECRHHGQSRGEKLYLVRMLEQETTTSIEHQEPTPQAQEVYQQKLAQRQAKIDEKMAVHETKEAARFREWEAKSPTRRKPFVPKSPPKLPPMPVPPKGSRHVVRTPVEGVFRCPKHKDEVDSYQRPCAQCKAEVLAVIESKRFVVVNYDILAAQKDKDDTGTTYVRQDLPGWGAILARYAFGMAIADESHRLRGWQAKGPGAKDATTRRERANEVCASIPRVYAATGTPVFGFTRDLWGQLDFISLGLWS